MQFPREDFPEDAVEIACRRGKKRPYNSRKYANLAPLIRQGRSPMPRGARKEKEGESGD